MPTMTALPTVVEPTLELLATQELTLVLCVLCVCVRVCVCVHVCEWVDSQATVYLPTPENQNLLVLSIL